RGLDEANVRVGSLQRQLAVTQTSLKNTKALLDTRSAELRDAREFLTSVEDISDSEVLTLVERLNCQIYQAAASIANSSNMHQIPPAYSVLGEDALSYIQHTLTSLGVLPQNLLTALRGFNHSQDKLVVQIALQATMVGHIKWFCHTWDYQLPEIPSQLEHIYASIRMKEPQSVAGKWRALTRMHAKKLHFRVDEQQQQAYNLLTWCIVDVLLLCGVPGTRNTVYDMIVARFHSSILDMVKLALQIERTTGELITSRDLLVALAMPGEAFDVARMDDEWSGPMAPSPQGMVMCSTQLGLSKRQILSPRGGVRSEEVFTLLKPKVTLCSILDDLRKEDIQLRDCGVASQGRMEVDSGTR
ncbi:hypothetical protein C8Q73DRAFT_644262, partial [Cubamyces lactineus]